MLMEGAWTREAVRAAPNNIPATALWVSWVDLVGVAGGRVKLCSAVKDMMGNENVKGSDIVEGMSRHVKYYTAVMSAQKT